MVLLESFALTADSNIATDSKKSIHAKRVRRTGGRLACFLAAATIATSITIAAAPLLPITPGEIEYRAANSDANYDLLPENIHQKPIRLAT